MTWTSNWANNGEALACLVGNGSDYRWPRLRLRNPGIWILDETTSSIDAHGEMEIFAELRRISGNKIVIVVSHRASTPADDGQNLFPVKRPHHRIRHL